MEIGLTHFLVVSAILFAFGIFAVLTRKNAILVLMGLELILNSVNINFIAFSRFCASYGNINIEGHVATIFVIVLAAAEVAVALAIFLNIYQNFKHVEVEEIKDLKE